MTYIDRDPGDECTCDECIGFNGAWLTFSFAMRNLRDAFMEPFVPLLARFSDTMLEVIDRG